MILAIRPVKNNKELEEIMNIRKVVFTLEQKVPIADEYDGLDKNAEHIIVYYDKSAAGCARIRNLDGKIKLERIAILKEFRGQGFGGILVDYLINHSKKGGEEIIMNAQYNLKEFYQKHGFEKRGKPFFEAGIKHIEMYYNKSPSGEIDIC